MQCSTLYFLWVFDTLFMLLTFDYFVDTKNICIFVCIIVKTIVVFKLL